MRVACNKEFISTAILYVTMMIGGNYVKENNVKQQIQSWRFCIVIYPQLATQYDVQIQYEQCLRNENKQSGQFKKNQDSGLQ
jgi:hypothetical protein